MGATEWRSEPERSKATRRLENESGAPSSMVQPIWDPQAQIRPMVAVVDDSIFMRSVVESKLAREGISVLSFKGGLEFMAALRDGVIALPKVLLLDIGMPKMSGGKVARQLRANPAFRDVTLIVLTAHDSVFDRAYWSIFGAKFLGKPFEADELVRVVREALGMGSSDEAWP
jgi:chemosensory pili system protein ChpA (sensor histidine kinase/response regulator)